MTEDFIQKLMISKKIMEKSDGIPRNTNGTGMLNVNEMSLSSAPDLYTANPVNGTYNIPQEYMEAPQAKPIKPMQLTEDRIQNSKLPDAIKKLMIEHPIKQPESYSPTISDDILEKAARLMREEKQTVQTSKQTNTNYQNSKPINSDMKGLIRDTMEEILKDYGIISESESKTKDQFQFKVGKHIFEGTINKVKKIR